MAGGDEKKVDMTYYLGSSDNPGNVITLIQLRGQNYEEWARAIRTSLQAKRKYGFVEGEITKPTMADTLEDWTAVHSMLVMWLLNTIEPSLCSTLLYYDDAQILWNNLRQRFSVVNGPRICQLKASLGDCKQGKDELVSDYFGRLSRIWDQLVTSVKTPSCTCGGCTFNISQQVTDLRNENYLHHFLIGLDGAFALVWSTLLSHEPLPNIDQAYQRLIQDEILLRGESMARVARDNVMACRLTFESRGKSQSFDKFDKFCSYCSRGGHDASTCFHLHGFPDWWGDRPRGGRGTGRGGQTNSRGGRTGGRGRNASSGPTRAHKVTSAANDPADTAGHLHMAAAPTTEYQFYAGVFLVAFFNNDGIDIL